MVRRYDYDDARCRNHRQIELTVMVNKVIRSYTKKPRSVITHQSSQP